MFYGLSLLTVLLHYMYIKVFFYAWNDREN